MPELAPRVSEIVLVDLRGSRASNRRLGRAQVAVNLSISEIEGVTSAVMQRGDVIVTDASADDDDAAGPEFEAHATYLVELADPYNESQAEGIAEITWPYIRSAVNDLTARMGIPYVRLPVTLDDAALQSAGAHGGGSHDDV